MADECLEMQGGGCLKTSVPEECSDSDGVDSVTPSDSDTDIQLEGGGPFHVEGGGQCATAVAPAGWTLLVLLIALLRRSSFLVLLFIPGFAWAFDVQNLRLLDGGPWVSSTEADIGNPWTIRTALSGSAVGNPVWVVGTSERRALVDQAIYLEGGGSIAIKNWFRIGVSVPMQTIVAAKDTDVFPGSAALFLSIPMYNHPRLKLGMSTQLHQQLSGPNNRWADQSAVNIRFNLEGDRPIQWMFSTGPRVQRGGSMVGLYWGPRWEWAAGVGWSPIFARLEIFGSVPLVGKWGGNNIPVESLAHVGLPVGAGWTLRIGAGAGLTRGFQAPEWRALVALEYVTTPAPDRDRDRVRDSIDLCLDEPEDRDHFQDRDGCVDPDNDEDGILDTADACVNIPEAHNGYKDEDGCPDAKVELQVEVDSDRPDSLEEVAFTLDHDEHESIFPDEVLVYSLWPGPHQLEVVAAGHRPFSEMLVVPEQNSTLTIHLEANRFGRLLVNLVGPDGPIAGWVRLDPKYPVAGGGEDLNVLAGTYDLEVGAQGFTKRTLPVEIPVDSQVSLTIELSPALIAMQEGKMQLDAEWMFPLNSARMTAESDTWLDTLAGWLREHSEVRLLRVEGHADAPGTSAYNYDLSTRRAEAIIAALEARHIDRDRLQALGSGEAVTSGAVRRVDFTVLIWDESSADIPPNPPLPH